AAPPPASLRVNPGQSPAGKGGRAALPDGPCKPRLRTGSAGFARLLRPAGAGLAMTGFVKPRLSFEPSAKPRLSLRGAAQPRRSNLVTRAERIAEPSMSRTSAGDRDHDALGAGPPRRALRQRSADRLRQRSADRLR